MSFQLSIQGFTDKTIVVQRFEGKEGISKLFRFDVEAAIDSPDFQNSADLIGSPAVFSIAADATDGRQIHGVVARATKVQRVAKDGQVYRFRIVPHLWKRKHHLTSRVFQGTTAHAIAAMLLTAPTAPHGSSTGTRSSATMSNANMRFNIGNRTSIASRASSPRKASIGISSTRRTRRYRATRTTCSTRSCSAIRSPTPPPSPTRQS